MAEGMAALNAAVLRVPGWVLLEAIAEAEVAAAAMLSGATSNGYEGMSGSMRTAWNGIQGPGHPGPGDGVRVRRRPECRPVGMRCGQEASS